jgi:uncharacterized membrane protein YeaQ/YmgE (transglycosylase-associated protein family)
MGIVWWLIVGLIAGLLARALVPGRDRLGFMGTLLLGVAGSLVGGFLGQLFEDDRTFADFSPAGLIGSIIGAIIALLIYRWANRSRVA